MSALAPRSIAALATDISDDTSIPSAIALLATDDNGEDIVRAVEADLHQRGLEPNVMVRWRRAPSGKKGTKGPPPKDGKLPV